MSDRITRRPAATVPGISESVRVTAGDLLFLSGVVGYEPDGSPPADFARGVELCLRALEASLERGGATFSDLVRVNIYVTGLTPERLQIYREVRDRIVDTSNMPASTLIGAAALVLEDIEIEIDAIAAI